MNANDLADRLEQFYTGTHIQKAAETLRQQQAEIDVLKQQILMWENADVPTEVMAEVIIELEKRGFIEKTEKAQEKCPPASWWKGDPTCGGLTENYGLEKAQEK
jgi:hypothetical protein